MNGFGNQEMKKHIFPLEKLMHMYYNSVGHNSTLIMGLTPDPQGLLPQADVKRLEEWGAAIKKTFSNPIASTAGKGDRILLSLENSTIIENIVLQEDITLGQRVRGLQYSSLLEWTMENHRQWSKHWTQKNS